MAQGLSLAVSLNRFEQEQEKWQAAKPKNVTTLPEENEEEPGHTKEEWNAIGKAVSAIQASLLERQKIEEQLQWLQSESGSSSHGFAILSGLFFVGAA